MVILMTTDKENIIGSMAQAVLKVIVPILLAVLVYMASQATETLKTVVEQVQQIQITMAKDGADKEQIWRVISDVKAQNNDHEIRIRALETHK